MGKNRGALRRPRELHGNLPQHQARGSLDYRRARLPQQAASEEAMYDSIENASDQHLIKLCLARNESAWCLMIARHKLALFSYIRRRLREEGCSIHRCEDIFQDTWLALLENHGQRLHYHLQREGCFAAFLRAVAGQRIQLARRRARRRMQPVPLNGREFPDVGADDGLVHAQLAELRASLTPQQHRCLCEYLMGQQRLHEPALSENNARRLKYRIEKKLENFFGLV